ncbi:hypothetical protein [Streptomyces agglomeratus]|uniref:hypothetical protein n=1 Tax=Streptomyces agglomeratus TaxID=285458 RepID=UPI00159F2247|nr:hypothetical protein [Streptomyces agglomeratus]
MYDKTSVSRARRRSASMPHLAPPVHRGTSAARLDDMPTGVDAAFLPALSLLWHLLGG